MATELIPTGNGNLDLICQQQWTWKNWQRLLRLLLLFHGWHIKLEANHTYTTTKKRSVIVLHSLGQTTTSILCGSKYEREILGGARVTAVFALLKFAIWYWSAFLNKRGYVIHHFNAHFSLDFFFANNNNTREDSTHGHHQMVNTEIRLIIFFAAKDGEPLYSQQKQDRELTVTQIMNSLWPNPALNWRK